MKRKRINKTEKVVYVNWKRIRKTGKGTNEESGSSEDGQRRKGEGRG